MAEYEQHESDVVVVGAGGAGLRPAIEASAQGAKTALVCKSLLGKAHTVMAEGGIAAALGNVYSEDNWQVHFRDTMRGGKMLNNWRMAELHAREAPDRVYELEEWGALFDRTKDGRILQRAFGGHKYDRLAHVGDRTGLEMIRTLQQHAVHKGIDVFMECTVSRILKDGDRISGAVGYWRESGKLLLFKARAVVLATGGIGKAFKVTSNSWEYTGDGHSLAYWAGAELIDMEFVQFHPTGMVWPPSVRGILVTEGVRGEGGTLKNTDGKRFMFNYIPEFKGGDGGQRRRGRRLVRRQEEPPHPGPPAEGRGGRAINSEVKAGRGTPHGGVFLDIASRRSADYIRKRLPSMYHQFKELADVDITKEPMEVGPTCHYLNGGIRVDADSTATCVPGLFAAGEVAGGLHGANRLGGNSLSDLVVFGRRAGLYAAQYVKSLSGRAGVDAGQVERACRDPDALPGQRHREPLRGPRRSARVHAVAGGNHPHRGRSEGAGGDRRVHAAARARHGRGRPGVQPRLAPHARPARDARRLEADARRPGAEGGARRPHRDDYPKADPTGARSTWSCAGRTARRVCPRSRSPRCPTTSRSSSRRRNNGRLRSHDAGVARRRQGRRLQGVPGPVPGGHGGAGRDPRHSGDAGRRPGRAVELQGRQVRLLQRGDQRQAAAHVHDADEHVHAG